MRRPSRSNTRILVVATAGLLLVLVAAAAAGSRCDIGQQRSGCRIHAGLCVCGIGCPSDYMYTSKEECNNAINGQKKNQCSGHPCLHGGSCSQTTMDPGYKCRCEGTGFYGPRCQNECPNSIDMAALGNYPYECVVI